MGVCGEIYISGLGIALGYHNNEPMTNISFIDCPSFISPPLTGPPIIYKTGDFGKMRTDGKIEYPTDFAI